MLCNSKMIKFHDIKISVTTFAKLLSSYSFCQNSILSHVIPHQHTKNETNFFQHQSIADPRFKPLNRIPDHPNHTMTNIAAPWIEKKMNEKLKIVRTTHRLSSAR